MDERIKLERQKSVGRGFWVFWVGHFVVLSVQIHLLGYPGTTFLGQWVLWLIATFYICIDMMRKGVYLVKKPKESYRNTRWYRLGQTGLGLVCVLWGCHWFLKGIGTGHWDMTWLCSLVFFLLLFYMFAPVLAERAERRALGGTETETAEDMSENIKEKPDSRTEPEDQKEEP